MLNVLLATALVAATPPTPIHWTESPTGVESAVLYTAERAGTELWSVGIELEAGQEGSIAFHPLALRWTGTKWQKTKSAVPDGRLDDVLVKSQSEVWAVGATEQAGPPWQRPVLQRWNGSAWKRIATPPLAAHLDGQLTAIAPSRNNGILVAEYAQDESGEGFRTVRRYADGKWQALPRQGLQHVAYVDDLHEVSATEIWAAGIGGVARYDGKKWTEVELPIKMQEGRQFEVAQLVVRAPNDIWAVGEKPSETLWRQPLALHYDGTAWTEVAAPEITGQFHDLEFVDGKAFAVGGNPNTHEPLIAELVGKEFVQTTSPASGYLHGSVRVGKSLRVFGVATPGPGELARPFAGVGKLGS
ncbi:hypothetical protein [Kribbella deserti]|uniref:Exo-alpha-sialidase n=1 Tax=Kribbella deserti TaxID=1926257 RepID=A0ABV6QUP3_9ACTN